MLQYPAWKRCYELDVVSQDTVLLMHESDPHVLRGQLYALVAPLLDGSRSSEEIADELASDASAAEVFYALDRLAHAGHVVEHDRAMPHDAAFWQALGVDTRSLARRLQATPIALYSEGRASAEPLRRALLALKIHVADDAALSVVVTNDYLASGLEERNRRALRDDAPWMLVKLTGTAVWLGPIFRSGATGCWECLAQRLRGHRPLQTARRQPGRTFECDALASLPLGVETAAKLAAIEIAKWIAGVGQRLEGRVVTLDVARLAMTDHHLVKRPQCPACNPTRTSQASAIVRLESRRKQVTTGGGHRAVTPDETIARYGHHVSSITGAVRALRRVDESGALHSYDAGPNLALWGNPLSRRDAGFRALSGGKGSSDVQARASALCEALERYSGVFQGDEPRERARGRDLGQAGIDPSTCLLFSARQYERRREWNESCAAHELIPHPYDASATIDWTPVWSLTNETQRFVPTSYCYYGHQGDPWFCHADSNGCAAGNTREEAILQAFLELVERDAVSLWWYNRLRRPRVDLTSFGQDYFDEVAETYRARGRELWMIDLTSDLGIPTFAAVSRCTNSAREEILFGFGAHLDASVAAVRALTEMNQFLSVLTASPPKAAADWLQRSTLANQPYLDFDRDARPSIAADYRVSWSDDFAEDVRQCVAIAARAGLETLVVDQTRPDIGLPVVRVIVPGLRHFWGRFAPGRLYDVPVRMNWLSEPIPEQRLNPIIMFV